MAATPGLYANMLRLGRSASDTDIRKDIGRTLPREPLLASALHKRWRGPGLGMLYRVLTAFAHVAPDIGYTQGMSFLAAVALIVGMPEHTAFYWLLGAMYRLHLAVLFKPPLVAPQVAVEVAHALAHKRKPKLLSHLEALGVCSGSLYSISWLLSLFSTSVLPLSTILGILDCMHCEVLEEQATQRVPKHILRAHSAAQARVREVLSGGAPRAYHRMPPSAGGAASSDSRVSPAQQASREHSGDTAHAAAAQPASPPELPSAKAAKQVYLRRITRLPRALFRAILAHVFQLEVPLLACDAFDGIVQVLSGERIKRVRDQWLRERVLVALEAEAEGGGAAEGGLAAAVGSSSIQAPSPADPVIHVTSSGSGAGELLSEAVHAALANESLAPPYTLRPVGAHSPCPPPFHTAVTSEAPTRSDLFWKEPWGGRTDSLLDVAIGRNVLPAAAFGPPRKWAQFHADEGGPLVLPGYIKAAMIAQRPSVGDAHGSGDGAAVPPARSSSLSLPVSQRPRPSTQAAETPPEGGEAGSSVARGQVLSDRAPLRRTASMHPAALVLSAGGTHVDPLPPSASVMCDGLPCEPWMLPEAFLAAMNHKHVRVSDKDLKRAMGQACELLEPAMMRGALAAAGRGDQTCDEEAEWSSELCAVLLRPPVVGDSAGEERPGTVDEAPGNGGALDDARDSEHSRGDQRRGWRIQQQDS